MKKTLLMLMCIMVCCCFAAAQTKGGSSVRLPRFFTDGMVLQRGESIPVWGWGKPHTKVEVMMCGKKASATVGEDGKWKVMLPKMKVGGPYTLAVLSEGDHVKAIKDVMVGDVFLCSGQSNMELPISRCMDAVGEEVKDYENYKIRYLKLPHQYNYVRPNDDVKTSGGWVEINPETCGGVSAICYFMAKELQESQGVPIGIINSSVGGTQVQAWMPKRTLRHFKGYEREFEQRKYTQENWVDSVRRVEAKAGNEWEQTMADNDRVMGEWRTDGYDFSKWMTVNMFADWSNLRVVTTVTINEDEQVSESQRYRNGSYWFRTTVTLPAELAGKRGVLRFGAMKDADSIFVNGQYVGNTTYEYPPRIYDVKEGILREGENDIVVHLMSQNGKAGFTRGKLYQLEVGELVFPIKEDIQMAVGCFMTPKPTSTYFVDCPSALYNAMIAPLGDFPIKGMVWYQGESNQGKPGEYAALLGGMVEAWRHQFESDFPVVIVQLPGYMSKHDEPVETGWTRIRHQQYLASKHIHHAALVPTLDTGEYNDIHPQDKREVGKRVAWQMERLAYGKKSAVGGGPMPVSATVKDGEAIISFDPAGGKLKDAELRDFAVKVNGKYQWATAMVTGDYTVAVMLPWGMHGTSVRYGWDDYPEATLFNTDGVPAPQFEIEVK